MRLASSASLRVRAPHLTGHSGWHGVLGTRTCHNRAPAVSVELTHIDSSGEAAMVDVSTKPDTTRTAVAGSSVHLGPDAFAALTSGANAKGNVLAAARLAGIMAAKRTSDLIPLCHPVSLSHVAVHLHERPEVHALDIEASATCTAATGVEMEALTAAAVAALTVYDMCKAVCVNSTMLDPRTCEPPCLTAKVFTSHFTTHRWRTTANCAGARTSSSRTYGSCPKRAARVEGGNVKRARANERVEPIEYWVAVAGAIRHKR